MSGLLFSLKRSIDLVLDLQHLLKQMLYIFESMLYMFKNV